jgi:DNA-binding transcriptional LysR family regulator
MEQRLAVSLLARHSRGIRLTEAGAAFLSRAKPALRAIEEAERAVAAYREPRVAHVSFGVTPTAGRALLPDLLQACEGEGLHLTLREGASQDFCGVTAEGLLDFSLCYNPENSAALEIIPLYTEELFLIGPPDQIETARGPIAISDVAAYPLVLGESKHVLRQLIERSAAACGVPLNIVMEMKLIALKREVLLGTGRCTISPRGLLNADIARGRLGARAISPAISATLCLLVHAGGDPEPRDILLPIVRRIIDRRLQEGEGGWRSLEPAP